MLRSVSIENFKSISQLNLELGRTNVFIGENGAGKSNVLEALAIAGAAQARKLDNEFLTSRGIRVPEASLMRSAFLPDDPCIKFKLVGDDRIETHLSLSNDGHVYSQWKADYHVDPSKSGLFIDAVKSRMEGLLTGLSSERRGDFLRTLKQALENALGDLPEDQPTLAKRVSIPAEISEGISELFAPIDNQLADFVIYSPESSALRRFDRGTQVEPLGVNGEGLFKLLNVMQTSEPLRFKDLKKQLRLLDWFRDVDLYTADSVSKMLISDRYIYKKKVKLEEISTNEGFLFIVFYTALFTSSFTPSLFAIDNIDASLNPKLCERLIQDLVKFSVKYDKQSILTTHNPALLNGLDLTDDEQRLFVIRRDQKGHTKVDRYNKPLPEGYPRKMSDLFLSGLVGGLPKSF